MKINKHLIPIKIHYFCFLGCVAPILPFLIVLGVQLGIPVVVTGGLNAAFLVSVIFLKPIIAGIADAFPHYRRFIFLFTLSIMTGCFSCLYFIPPMREDLKFEAQVVRVGKNGGEDVVSTPEPKWTQLPSIPGETMLLAEDDGGCFIAVAWDCVARCSEPQNCINATTSLKVTALKTPHKLHILSPETHGEGIMAHGGSEHSGLPLWGFARDKEEEEAVRSNNQGRLYRIEGATIPLDLINANISVECEGGEWHGSECLGVVHYGQFWVFILLLFAGTLNFNTAISVTDAIIVDTIGTDGDYGIQRAWGTVGWGLMGPVSGLLIDLFSGTSITKNYAPAFIICFILGSVDILVSATTIRVPKINSEADLLRKVWPILRHPRFFVFCIFVILNGCFDGLAASFIFIMQEDMAKGTSAMNYMKLIQGLTLFVQCGIEAPFMFINKWFMDRLGAHYVTSLVFFLYIFRLFGLCVAGAYWPVWSTLVVEVLNGPTYGLGYTAIVVHSSRLSPPGTSTTVQSLTNLCYESLGYALAMFGGGQLYSALGGPGMYLVAGIVALVTFILHIISLQVLPPPPEVGGPPEESSAKDNDEEENIKLHVEREAEVDGEERALRKGEGGMEQEGEANREKVV